MKVKVTQLFWSESGITFIIDTEGRVWFDAAKPGGKINWVLVTLPNAPEITDDHE